VEPSSRVTIRDVAARAGVSVATVSKVINRRYGVAAGTSARVQAVIDEFVGRQHSGAPGARGTQTQSGGAGERVLGGGARA